MKKFLMLLAIIAFVNCKSEPKKTAPEAEKETSLMAGSDTLIYPEEKYFKSSVQDQFGRLNIEEYLYTCMTLEDYNKLTKQELGA